MAARAWSACVSPITATRRPAAAPPNSRSAWHNLAERARFQRRARACPAAAAGNGAVRSGGASPEPSGPLSAEELAAQLAQPVPLLNAVVKRWEPAIRAGQQMGTRMQAVQSTNDNGMPAFNMKAMMLALAGWIVNPPWPDPAGLAAIRQLLQAGAEVDERAPNSQGMTALHLASRFRDAEAAQLLLAAGGDPNLQVLQLGPGITSLILACDFEDVPLPCNLPALPLVKLLIEAGADVNTETSDGWTPLLLVLKNEERLPKKQKDAADTVALLLASGADPNKRCPHGLPPLAFCVIAGAPESGQPEAMRHLLEAGADPNPTFQWGDKQKMQLLELAAQRDCEGCLLPQLVQHADLSGQQAVALGRIYNGLCRGGVSRTEVLRLMRERSADPSWAPAEEDTSGYEESK